MTKKQTASLHDSLAHLKIIALAITYCVYNQLTFVVFLTADPASYNIFKSASTIVTAAISCVFLGRCVSRQQWAAIILQASGLFVTQYDTCKSQMVLPKETYVLLLVLLFMTSLSGVWNEHQLKTLPMSLHQQNMVLYSAGFVLNASGHFIKSWLSDTEPGFFAGYDATSVAVVTVNACFGITMTAVYKYADSIMKCLANAVTTVLLLGLSCFFFGLQLNLTIAAGCLIVIVAVILYSTLS